MRQAYDLLAYNLNLFYNSALYWPRKANPALLALVFVCVAGWLSAGVGKFGAAARHLAVFGLFATALPATFSILGIYTFGGDRRSVYLSPFIFTFTALGLYLLCSVRRLRWITALVGIGYLILWAVELPAFYRERMTPYSTADLLAVWRDSGKLPIYVGGGGADAVSYTLHDYPEVQVQSVPATVPPAPYLYLSLHWPLQQDQWDVRHAETLHQRSHKVTLLLERPAKYMSKLGVSDVPLLPAERFMDL